MAKKRHTLTISSFSTHYITDFRPGQWQKEGEFHKKSRLVFVGTQHLVSVPEKRNKPGVFSFFLPAAVNAVSCADMALAGIESRVPPDQVLDAMAEVGRSLPTCCSHQAVGSSR